DVILPNVNGTATLLFGFAKFAQLKMLKNSVRNSPRTLSVIGMNLTTEKSMFFCPGPYRKLRGVFPNGLFGSKFVLVGVPILVPDRTNGLEATNALMSKNPFSRSCVLPLVSMLPVNPDAKFARWITLLPTTSIIEYGVPVCSVRMPFNCQLLSTTRAELDSETSFGKS